MKWSIFTLKKTTRPFISKYSIYHLLRKVHIIHKERTINIGRKLKKKERDGSDEDLEKDMINMLKNT